MDSAQQTPGPALRDAITTIAEHTVWLADRTSRTLHHVPGSAVLVRYVRASYQ